MRFTSSHPGENTGQAGETVIIEACMRNSGLSRPGPGPGDGSALRRLPQSLRSGCRRCAGTCISSGRQGLLRRVHGGAIPAGRRGCGPAGGQRAGRNQEERTGAPGPSFAGFAVTGVIVPGCGAAMARIPRMLSMGWALTVVTSSLQIAPAWPARPGLQVLAAGGRAWSRTLAAAGRRAGNALAGVRAGVAGAGAGDGLVPEPGFGGLRVAQA